MTDTILDPTVDELEAELEPPRLVLLTTFQRETIARALRLVALADTDSDGLTEQQIACYVEQGEEYVDARDEYTRKTLHKRAIDAYKKRLTERLDDLEQQLVDELLDSSDAGWKHDATGKTVSFTRKLWAKVKREGKDATLEEKQAACDGLKQAGAEFAGFVREDFNVNSLSAHFRQLYETAAAAERAKPEEARRPVDIQQLLPASCHGVIELTDRPALVVRG